MTSVLMKTVITLLLKNDFKMPQFKVFDNRMATLSCAPGTIGILHPSNISNMFGFDVASSRLSMEFYTA